ncbi:MAG: S8 family serine peptidase [Bdellovibrionota bacterium]
MQALLVPVLLGLSLVAALFGCGRAEDLENPYADERSYAPDIRFATDAEIAAGDVAEHSYIIGFREQSVADAATAKLQFSTIQQGLAHILQSTQKVDFSRALARLNITYPGRSFAAQTSLNATPFFQSELQVPEEFTHITEVTFADEASARAQINLWHQQKKINYAEPNFKRTTSGEVEDRIVSSFKGSNATPWLDQVSFVDAIQKIGLTGAKAEPLIAVMDSGVDVLHPNLKDAIFTNEAGQNKQCRNDIYGCNTTVEDKEILGDGAVYPSGTSDFGEVCLNEGQCDHGTHVAGIIGARNSANFTGMCPYCKILVVKVVEIEEKNGRETFPIKDSSILAGLSYVSGFKTGGQPLVRVINASFGKFESSRSVELFIKALKKFGRGTLMVAAAGNEDTMKRQYPAGFDEVLAVSNIKSAVSAPNKSASSNFGMWVDIAAPGDGDCGPSSGILSTIPGGGSACRVGTSMASPMVAGIAGLVLANDPTLSAEALESRLMETANPTKLYEDGVNNSYRPKVKGAGLVPLLGGGVVNALVAIDPSLDTIPAVVAQRPDAVRPGCGVIGGQGQSSALAFLMILLIPFLGLIRRFRRRI